MFDIHSSVEHKLRYFEENILVTIDFHHLENYTTDAFQMKHSLTDILEMHMC